MPRARTTAWSAWLWTLALCVLLLAPGKAFDAPSGGWLELLPEGTDKWVHAALFAGEVFWLERHLRQRHPRSLLLTVAVATALAVATELGQRFSPGRDPALGDLAANMLGIAASALTLHFTAKRIR